MARRDAGRFVAAVAVRLAASHTCSHGKTMRTPAMMLLGMLSSPLLQAVEVSLERHTLGS